MKNKITIDTYYGMIKLNLKTIMDRQNISINYMSRLTGIKYDVVKRHYYNRSFQADFNTLAKFCYILNCNIEDILVYEYIEKKQGKQKVNN